MLNKLRLIRGRLRMFMMYAPLSFQEFIEMKEQLEYINQEIEEEKELVRVWEQWEKSFQQ